MGEDAEQRVENLWENGFQIDGTRETLADVQHGFQLGFRADFQLAEQGAGCRGDQRSVLAAYGHLIIADQLGTTVDQAQCKVGLAAARWAEDHHELAGGVGATLFHHHAAGRTGADAGLLPRAVPALARRAAAACARGCATGRLRLLLPSR